MVGNQVESISVVVLAGGFGTRVAHLLPNVPKPMAEIAGRPFLEWVVRYFHGFGLEQFVLSTGHLAATIESYFSKNPVAGVDIRCRQETTALGTAGGFLLASEGMAEPAGGWLVANGDSLVVSNPLTLMETARQNNWEAAILGLQVPDASRFGSLRTAGDGRLLAFAEKSPGAGLINGGVYWFAPGGRSRFSKKRPLSFELDVFPALIAARSRVGVVPVCAPFIDIGTPATLAAAESFIRANFATHLH